MGKVIKVYFDMKATELFWLKWVRYHYRDYDSSMSKMRWLTNIDLDDNCIRLIIYMIYKDFKRYEKLNKKSSKLDQTKE